MALLPASAPTSTLNLTSNIADLLSKPISCHRFDTLIGDIHSAHYTAVDPTPAASTTLVVRPTVAPTPIDSDSVPTAPTLPIVLDTGASFSISLSKLDFLPVAQAPYGLFRSASVSVVSGLKATSTSVDPYTLITGEDIASASDLSSPDTAVNSDSGSSFTKVYFDIRQFGTSTLTFIYSKSTLELLHIFVEPTQIDWQHWIPLPRLTPTESYFHIFGLDYLQAFALFHLIPIWICLLHFAVNLE